MEDYTKNQLELVKLLTDLYNITSGCGRIEGGLTNFIKNNYTVKNRTFLVKFIREKLTENISKDIYEWVGGKPNIHTAIKLEEMIWEYQQNYIKKYNQRKAKLEQITKKNEDVKTDVEDTEELVNEQIEDPKKETYTEVSYFWGLYKKVVKN